MNLERQIKNKDKIIDDLSKENEALKEKNAQLESELFFERNIPKEGYEECKKLMKECEKAKTEYEKLSKDLRESMNKYDEARKDLLNIKSEYIKKMNGFLRRVDRKTRDL